MADVCKPRKSLRSSLSRCAESAVKFELRNFYFSMIQFQFIVEVFLELRFLALKLEITG